MMTEHFDCLIIGSGVGGCAAAIPLAQAGLRVAIVEQHPSVQRKIGESLIPASRRLLHDLGVWDEFQARSYLICYGNQSAWGHAGLHYTDFLRSPDGHGWQLDRQDFEALLQKHAQALGSYLFWDTRVIGVVQKEHQWIVESSVGDFVADQLIDASGRARWLARQFGIEQQRYDNLVAWVQILSDPATEDADTSTLIESLPDGWMYTVQIPHGQRIVAYLTDSDLPALRDSKAFNHLLQTTQYIQSRTAPYQTPSSPRGMAAHSSHLMQFSGTRWYAVGDAAMSFDPLSSQGLFNALYTGFYAAHSILGKAEASYQSVLTPIYTHYRKFHNAAYQSEQRWKNRLFWQRRHK